MRLAACVAILGEGAELHDDACLRTDRDAEIAALQEGADGPGDEPLAEPEPSL